MAFVLNDPFFGDIVISGGSSGIDGSQGRNLSVSNQSSTYADWGQGRGGHVLDFPSSANRRKPSLSHARTALSAESLMRWAPKMAVEGVLAGKALLKATSGVLAERLRTVEKFLFLVDRGNVPLEVSLLCKGFRTVREITGFRA